MGSKKSKMTESILQTTNSNNTTNDKQQTTYSSLGSNPGGAIYLFEENRGTFFVPTLKTSLCLPVIGLIKEFSGFIILNLIGIL